ncbi:MAG: XisI protein [Candidatus Parabeggiatoa sp. nov. 3]|nr:MAG: XisI protein [Gammaproteobacteria bacterium]RKZ62742.1 MAG: XisI protein [Gammaproteobacteria bacterium]RKZ77877.1 MAG: XisI protein [Gammaproteobacteria bacterium]
MASQIEFYKRCIKKLLSEYESFKSPWSNVELLFDDERMSYMAVRVGWLKYKRIHLCLVHIDILGEKMVIQCNNTENQVMTELLEMGIPREKISCGFLPPEARIDMEKHSRETIGV